MQTTGKDILAFLIGLLALAAVIAGIVVLTDIAKTHTTERLVVCTTAGGQWIDGDGISVCINPDGTVTKD